MFLSQESYSSGVAFQRGLILAHTNNSYAKSFLHTIVYSSQLGTPFCFLLVRLSSVTFQIVQTQLLMFKCAASFEFNNNNTIFNHL